MIAQLQGRLQSKAAGTVIVNVQGVGYELHVSLQTFYELPPEGSEICLHVHTHVREDQLTLFGFATLQEKMVFLQLLKVSGVGPNLAMTVLSGMTPKEVIAAVSQQDSARFKNIPGIGQKTAERILLDLKGKLALEGLPSSEIHTNGDSTYQEALSALTNLGYPRAQAERALAQVAWQETPTLEVSIRAALKQMMAK